MNLNVMGAVASSAASGYEPLTGWSHAKEITIPANLIDADLVNFPLDVYLTSSNFPFGDAKTGGEDVRFTNFDKSVHYKFERKEHSAAMQMAHYTVLIPSISDLSDTKVYCHYGNPSAFNASIEAWQDMTGKQLTYNGNVKLEAVPDVMRIATSTTGTDQCGFTGGTVATSKIAVLEARFKIETSGSDTSQYLRIANGAKAAFIGIKVGSIICNYLGTSPYTHTIDTTSDYIYCRIKLNGTTNAEFYTSANGVDWTLIHTATYANIATSTNNGVEFGDGTTAANRGGSALWKMARYNVDYGTTPANFVEWNPSKGKPTASGWGLDGTDLATLITETYIGRRAYYDGNGSYFTIPDSDDWNFGNGDFCIEANIKLSDIASQNNGILVKRVSATSGNSFTVYVVSTGVVQFAYSTSGSSNTSNNFSTVLSTNTLYHIAVVRSGSTVKLFVNGVQDSTTIDIGALSIYDSTTPVKIGKINDADTASQCLDGYILGERVTKGRARYTENFTPPSSFSIDGSDVVFCTNFDTVYDQNYAVVQHMGDSLVDATGNGNNGTATGTTVIDTALGKARSFSGSKIAIPDHASLEPLSSDFNLLVVAKPSGTATAAFVLSKGTSASAREFLIYQDNANWRFWGNATATDDPLIAAAGALTTDIQAICASRQGNNFKLWKDGTVIGTDTFTGSIINSSGNLNLGADYAGTSGYFAGNQYEFREQIGTRSDAWIKAESLALKNSLLTFADAA